MTHPMLNIAISAARSAGTVISRAMDRTDTIKTTRKEGHDFVSDIDHQAEAVIIKTIAKPILSMPF